MKKTSYLQSSVLLSQLEARLQKNPYLSRGALPSWEDARVFLAIELLKKIPNRQTHSCLYHWYVIMKQFSIRTLQAWSQGAEENDEEDHVINEFVWEANSLLSGVKGKKQKVLYGQTQYRRIFEEKFDHSRNIVTSPKNTKRRMSQNYVEFNQNTNLSQKQIMHSPVNPSPLFPLKRVSFDLLSQKNDNFFLSAEQEYRMEIQLNDQQTSSLNALKGRLTNQRLNLLSFEGRDGANVQIVFRIDAEGCQTLKDKISQWPQVSNIRFRREKKTGCFQQIKSEKNLFSPLRKIANIST